MGNGITILGIFVADATFRGSRAPDPGETVLANTVQIGPGGKGSNQSVAAGRLGADVTFLTRLGQDAFSDMAMGVWKAAGVSSAAVHNAATPTGAASIFVNEVTAENQIIVCPGAAAHISVADIDAWADRITSASVFLTQLEQPIAAAAHALKLARGAGVTTILNPAPCVAGAADLLPYCDYVTPNETEAEELTGQSVTTIADARKAADILLKMGAGAAVITLGDKGALLHRDGQSDVFPAHKINKVVDTTGAGDAFNGGFATALSRGMTATDAVKLGCIVAGLSVTKPGAAASMPDSAAVDAAMDQIAK